MPSTPPRTRKAARRGAFIQHVVVSAAIFAIAIAGVAGASLLTHHLDSLELKSYDFLMSVLRGPLPTPDDIAIVAIDDSSMKEFAGSFSWPWPRSVHAELVRQLGAAGARAIVFDVVFDLPSAPDEDAELANAIKASPVPVVLAATIDTVNDGQFQMTQKVLPLPLLVEAGARAGFATIYPDTDEALRRVPLSVNGAPTLSSAAFMAGNHPASQAPPTDVRANDPEFLVNFAGPRRTIKTVSYYQAIDAANSLPHDIFKGKWVFVGRSLSESDLGAAQRAQDMFGTPFDLQMPGVEIHANALRTLATGSFIRHGSPAQLWALLLGVGALMSVVMIAIPGFKAKAAAALLLILAVPAVSAAAFLYLHFWLYTVQPTLVATTVFVLNALVQYRASEKDRAFVRKAMTGYVSKQVMQRLMDDPSALALGGVQLDATVLFSDIVGFSPISERMTPPDLTALLNAYFNRVGDAVMSKDGMIDKFIGDAVMAVWGIPLPDERHAEKACSAALDMKIAAAADGGPLRARIGINTGPMMAGNLGHRDRMAYTVIGDSVNLASRIEGANKTYGTTIMVSESTAALAGDRFVFRKLDRIRVVGKKEPTSVFELMCRAEDPVAATERARAQSFARVVSAYEARDWRGAQDVAVAHQSAYPVDDPVLALYVERCRQFEREPPPDDWDSVYTAKSK